MLSPVTAVSEVLRVFLNRVLQKVDSKVPWGMTLVDKQN